MKKAIAYTRVSTEKQNQMGTGPEQQDKLITFYAEKDGYEIKRTFRVVGTGKHSVPTRDRAGLQEALEYARENNLPIIVADVSRVTRSTKAMHSLILKEKVKFIFVTAEGKFGPISVLANVYQAEVAREHMSTCTREALALRKQQGVVLGNPTNLSEAQKRGASSSKQKANDRATDISPVIRNLQSDGYRSLNALSHKLNELGVTTARGGKWHPTSVKNLLQRVAEPKATPLLNHEVDYPHKGSW